MQKKYSVSETTKVEREKIANDALGISTLDATEPTKETKALVNQYILGNMEISDVLQKTINRYKTVNAWWIMKIRDNYLYDDIPVLKNILDIKDEELLNKAESNITHIKLLK